MLGSRQSSLKKSSGPSGVGGHEGCGDQALERLLGRYPWRVGIATLPDDRADRDLIDAIGSCAVEVDEQTTDRMGGVVGEKLRGGGSNLIAAAAGYEANKGPGGGDEAVLAVHDGSAPGVDDAFDTRRAGSCGEVLQAHVLTFRTNPVGVKALAVVHDTDLHRIEKKRDLKDNGLGTRMPNSVGHGLLSDAQQGGRVGSRDDPG